MWPFQFIFDFNVSRFTVEFTAELFKNINNVISSKLAEEISKHFLKMVNSFSSSAEKYDLFYWICSLEPFM